MQPHCDKCKKHWEWASYQICKIAGCACTENAGNVFPHRRIQMKLLVSDPGMHHGTCVTHVPWCMSGSLTHGGGENVPGIPGTCASAILRIWQEAHAERQYCKASTIWVVYQNIALGKRYVTATLPKFRTQLSHFTWHGPNQRVSFNTKYVGPPHISIIEAE